MSKYSSLTMQELKILGSLVKEDMYGYQILKELNSNILLGSLYNTLKSMEKKGFVKSRWGEETSNGGRRKYYKITGLGIEQFEFSKAEIIDFLNINLT